LGKAYTYLRMKWASLFWLIASSLAKPANLTIRVGNCVQNSPFKFLGCVDILGTWMQKPSNILVDNTTTFVIEMQDTNTMGTSTGNCTWQFTAPHGDYIAYVDWNYNPLGNKDFGLGSLDRKDDTVVSLTTPSLFNEICGVFATGQDGLNYCIAKTCPVSAGCSGWSLPMRTLL